MTATHRFFFVNNWIFLPMKKKILPNVILAIKNIVGCILLNFDNYRYLQYWLIWKVFQKEILVFQKFQKYWEMHYWLIFEKSKILPNAILLYF